MQQIQRLRCACAGLVLAASTAGAAPPPRQAGEDWTAVNADVLDGARGGFSFGSGLAISFGLERLVALNGSVVSLTRLQLPDLAHLSADQAEQTRAALSSVKLIQAGDDNIYVRAAPAQTPGGVVIQNSLNDQVIRSQTVITASVNSLSLLQAMRFERSLAETLAQAANPH
jgi:hypothetical protein